MTQEKLNRRLQIIANLGIVAGLVLAWCRPGAGVCTAEAKLGPAQDAIAVYGKNHDKP